MTAYSEEERMNDRELLELAAKAAGLEGYKYDARMKGCPLCKEVRDESGMFMRYDIWNPLADDGDALRLAVRFPTTNLLWFIAEAWKAHDKDEDRRAYVRLAITTHAAVAGRAMP